MLKKLSIFIFAMLSMMTVSSQAAEHYVIDTKGMHAAISFRIQHLGYSILQGQFKKFSGEFDYDEKNPAANKVSVTIDMSSVDTNHAERNKHIKSPGFFDIGKFATATFESSHWKDLGDGKATLTGTLNFRGIKKEISIDVEQIGGGKDPWGGFRRGFVGTTSLQLSDFNMKDAKMLGPVSNNVDLWLSIEGIRQ